MSMRFKDWVLEQKERAQAEQADAWMQEQERLERGRQEPLEEQIITQPARFYGGGEARERLQEPQSKMSRSPRISRPPGFKLQAFADFWFSRKTNKNVLEPVLRDLQDEHLEALACGRMGKLRWVRIRGTWSFWTTVVAQLPISLLKWVLKVLKTTVM